MMAAAQVKRFRSNYVDEVNGAAVYRALASAEKDPKRAEIFTRLAGVEEAHARFWAEKARAAGATLPRARLTFRTRTLAFFARHFGVDLVLPLVMNAERRDGAKYDAQEDAVSAGIAQSERDHAVELELMAAPGTLPASGALTGAGIARLEGRRHQLSGNALRAAVLGANDGLVSNMSLVMGVAGAALDERAILMTGIAGMIAGGCSMALGEWLSVNSSRELYANQIRLEAEELAANPQEERKELELIYQAKGLPEAEAQALAARLMADPKTALNTLAREELGVDPDELGGSAYVAAATSFALFTLGAVIPVIAFAVASGSTAIIASLASGAAGLFAIGAMTSLFTGRGAVFSGLRQLAIGLAAAAITYGAGSLAGAALS